MKLGYSLRQVIICNLCDEPFDEDHDGSQCPRAALKFYSQSLKTYGCPVCHEGECDVNAADWFECRNCHTQFTAGELGAEESSERLYFTNLDRNEWFPVRLLDGKGDGEFKSDLVIARLQAEIDRVKKEKGIEDDDDEDQDEDDTTDA